MIKSFDDESIESILSFWLKQKPRYAQINSGYCNDSCGIKGHVIYQREASCTNMSSSERLNI